MLSKTVPGTLAGSHLESSNPADETARPDTESADSLPIVHSPVTVSASRSWNTPAKDDKEAIGAQ